jgi:hypothetical protein
MDVCAYATFIPKIPTISKWTEKSNEKGTLFSGSPAITELEYTIAVRQGIGGEEREVFLYAG